jgi:hypothetical protein
LYRWYASVVSVCLVVLSTCVCLNFLIVIIMTQYQ